MAMTKLDKMRKRVIVKAIPACYARTCLMFLVRRIVKILLCSFAAFICAVPSGAGVLFSDLGTGNDVYNSSSGAAIIGSGNPANNFTSSTFAFGFLASGSGNEAVGQN